MRIQYSLSAFAAHLHPLSGTGDQYCGHPHGSWDGNLDPSACADWRVGCVPAPAPSPKPSDKGNLKELVKKYLQALGRSVANLDGKTAAALPGIIGSIVSWLLNTLGKTATWLAKNLCAMAIVVGTLLLVAARDWLTPPQPKRH